MSLGGGGGFGICGVQGVKRFRGDSGAKRSHRGSAGVRSC